jgi:hypothetical protein
MMSTIVIAGVAIALAGAGAGTDAGRAERGQAAPALVVIAGHGRRFHRPGCGVLRRYDPSDKRRRLEIRREEALARGLTACAVCGRRPGAPGRRAAPRAQVEPPGRSDSGHDSRPWDREPQAAPTASPSPARSSDAPRSAPAIR